MPSLFHVLERWPEGGQTLNVDLRMFACHNTDEMEAYWGVILYDAVRTEALKCIRVHMSCNGGNKLRH